MLLVSIAIVFMALLLYGKDEVLLFCEDSIAPSWRGWSRKRVSPFHFVERKWSGKFEKFFALYILRPVTTFGVFVLAAIFLPIAKAIVGVGELREKMVRKAAEKRLAAIPVLYTNSVNGILIVVPKAYYDEAVVNRGVADFDHPIRPRKFYLYRSYVAKLSPDDMMFFRWLSDFEESSKGFRREIRSDIHIPFANKRMRREDRRLCALHCSLSKEIS